jgi:hypothetical protein
LFTHLLQTEVQNYIRTQLSQPVAKLALQKNPFPGVEWTSIINQVAALQKAKDKLPTWFAAENIIYPSKISVEQTSSEAAAQYKSELISGESLIDLTGGFGVDDYYFARQVSSVTHCELDPRLSAIAKHNFKVLGTDNITCIQGESFNILKSIDKQWDWIYVDPARRSDAKGKVFMLKDCMPNVPQLLNTYFNYTNNILVKTAPLLDITAGLNELTYVKAIHIVAVNNEVKELLWVLQKGWTASPDLIAVNLHKEGKEIFKTSLHNDTQAVYSLPKTYLYEPNSAIMKSGAFDAVGNQYKIEKLHRHTQLYTSDNVVDFPGRRFIINTIVPYHKAEMKKHIEGRKMNVTVRNFPIQVSDIAKKWKIKDGGDNYSFFTTNADDEKVVLLCSKL